MMLQILIEIIDSFPLDIKKKITKVKINSFNDFHELKGFIITPFDDYFTALISSDI